MPECIHGFDEGLCDVCYPRTPARTPVRQRSAATGRRETPRGRGTTRGLASRAGTSGPAPFSLSSQRVYHVTHVRNLEAILIDGALRADATPEVDASSATARELRRAGETPAGTRVSDHVAFYLTPEANRWRELREGAAGAHWSAAARASNPTEYVVLAVPAERLGDDIIATDGDAGAATSRFAAGAVAATALLRQVRAAEHAALLIADPAHPEAAAADVGLRDAELLAGPSVPADAIALIGVANEPVRDRVRAILREVGGAAPKVAVYPPWFQ